MPRSDEKTRARLEMLEHEAREHPRRHALRLFALVMFGYAYPLAMLVVSFALVVGVIALLPTLVDWASTHWVLIFYPLAIFVAALGLTAAVLRTFFVSPPPPDGIALAPADAPELWQLIDDVARSLHAPPVHRIHLTPDMNAAVTHRPRFGLWGPHSNYLILGLPMLVALTPAQLRSVLAHELGHLRGRHGRFGSWIWRVHATWESLAAPFRVAGKFRRLLMGWWVRLYGSLLGTTTLALRRLHEYDADRAAAELDGRERTAATLLAFDWAQYRLGRDFWPAVLREAGREPLPPNDVIGRMAEFWSADPAPDVIARWRNRELRSRTPITSDHPCLADRLSALGSLPLLERATAIRATPIDASCATLLGDCRERVWKAVGVSWKAMAMPRWRYVNATAKQAQEKAKKSGDAESDDDASKTHWEQIRVRAEYAPPDEAAGLLREFIAQHPDHAASNFTLGHLLLDQDDDDAASHLETAMAHDSDYIFPGLSMLLDYYRSAGRDADADPIRVRLEEHQRRLTEARRERIKVSRRDRLTAHELPPSQIDEIRRVLFRFPQVQAAYLARQQVRLFADKPSYVLAIRRHARPLEDRRKGDKFLTEALGSQIELPCAVVILGWTSPRLRARLLKACPAPIFLTAD